MPDRKFVAYYRVSTQRQGASGLGLEAQQDQVARYLNGGDWKLVEAFREVETGKGSNALATRPQLKLALDACRKHDATLVIAKLDRLARNVRFVAELMESRVKFVACDMPEANDLTIHVMAAFAEHEAKRISERTKEALARAKARGTVLGAAGAKNLAPNIELRRRASREFAEGLRGIVDSLKGNGLSQRAMVIALNQANVKTARGKTWSLLQLQRLLRCLASPASPTGKRDDMVV